MSLRLGRLVFAVECATLTASIPDPHWAAKYDPHGDHGLSWGLSVECDATNVGGMTFEPRVYHEAMKLPVRRWKETAGVELSWDAPYDEGTGEPNGGIYLVEHGDIRSGRIEFLSRERNMFRVRWSGLCDVHWNSEFGENVPFSLDARAQFTEIRVRGSEADTWESIHERLRRYMEVDTLSQGPFALTGHRYQDGVSMALCVFRPVV